MASFADGKIEVFLGPEDLGGADDLERVLVEFIADARRSLSIAVQELDSRPVAQAILDARWRGVRVEVFLEQDYLQTSLPARPADPTPEGDETVQEARRRVQWEARPAGLSDNRAILAALLGNDVTVKGDYNPAVFHQKFVLRDYDGTAR
ncbi:MAG: hypothetical protein M3O70_05585, partial [Actinomycetota bacterium]|nr:hypothetical protein [Actinomycetota bacterium]